MNDIGNDSSIIDDLFDVFGLVFGVIDIDHCDTGHCHARSNQKNDSEIEFVHTRHIIGARHVSANRQTDNAQTH